MEKLKFHTEIDAPAGKVWQVLWEDSSYRQWTSVFSPGSYAESEWKEGSKIRFLGPDGDGMHGTIEKLVPSEVMIFKHLGEVKGGLETETGWTDARESYHLSEKNGITSLEVELDIVEEFKEYFNSAFPKALQIVKEISEK